VKIHPKFFHFFEHEDEGDSKKSFFPPWRNIRDGAEIADFCARSIVNGVGVTPNKTKCQIIGTVLTAKGKYKDEIC
jgi:hypothetical protein